MAKKAKKISAKVSISEALRSPFRDGEEAPMVTDADYAFFLQCFELYRVIELADRTLDSMVEAYSKYRTRDLFKETLATKTVALGEESLKAVEPKIHATLVAMFNLIHELRLSLLYEDALPFTVKARVEAVMAELKREWNALQPDIEARYQWKFKSL